MAAIYGIYDLPVLHRKILIIVYDQLRMPIFCNIICVKVFVKKT